MSLTSLIVSSGNDSCLLDLFDRQGNTGGEEVLFLRLYLLHSLLAYLEGNGNQAVKKLKQVFFQFRHDQLANMRDNHLSHRSFADH